MITAYGSDLTVTDYADLTAASFATALLAFAGRWAGVRAPNVTRRNLGLSRFERRAATLALSMSSLSILVGLFHLVRHVFL